MAGRTGRVDGTADEARPGEDRARPRGLLRKTARSAPPFAANDSIAIDNPGPSATPVADGLALLDAEGRSQFLGDLRSIVEAGASDPRVIVVSESANGMLAHTGSGAATAQAVRDAEFAPTDYAAVATALQDDGAVSRVVVRTEAEGGARHYVAFDRVLLAEEVESIAPGARLTAAEWRLLMQMLAGRTLREAAAEDEVAYDTKRSQLRTLSAKLGAGRQADLVMALLFQLVRRAALPSAPTGMGSTVRAMHERHLSDTVRLIEMRTPSGTPLFVTDMGPVTGHPVLVVTSVAQFPVTETYVEQLHRRNLRLLQPYRPGSNGTPYEPVDDERYKALCIEQLRTLKPLFFPGPMDMIGGAIGSIHAIDFMLDMPDEIGRVVLAAPFVPPAQRITLAQRYLGAVKDMAYANPVVLDRMIDYYLRRIGTLDKFKHTLRSYYSECPADVAVLDGMSAEDWRLLQHGYRSTKPAYLHAMRLHHAFDWSKLEQVTQPVLVLSGTEDAEGKRRAIASLAARIPGAVHREIRGAGELPADHFAATYWDVLADWFEGRMPADAPPPPDWD